MLNVLLACATVVVQADTAPIVLAGAPAATVATVATVAASTSSNFVADSMVLEKSRRQLTLFYRGQEVRKYGVALGKNPTGDKLSRGDGRTPEGLFYIEGRNPQSKYHLSLRISYPDAAHRSLAKQHGTSAGGDIMIHGLPPAFAMIGALHRQQDWTLGCVAVTNEEIEEIWRAVPDGARILIKP
jgi:murein L,D-transpeptidase YafK